MAVPNDRRIVYGASVIPQQSYSTTSTAETTEEGYSVGIASYTKYKIDTGVNKMFGGKSTVSLYGGNHVQIRHDQASDLWTSMISMKALWTSTDDTWEDSEAIWGNDGSGYTVTTSGAVLRSGSTAIKFLYIKNIGSVECQLALEASGGTDEYDILIPAGAAVSMRTTSSVTAATVKVQTEASSGTTTTIEYVIAI